MTKLRWIFAAAAVLVVWLTAAWLLRPAGSSQAQVPDPRVPASAEVRGLVLPFDAYGMTTGDIAVLLTAEDAAVARCLRQRWQPSDAAAGVEFEQNRRRYGVVEDEVARRYGFHPPPLPALRPGAEEAPERCVRPARASLLRGVPKAEQGLLERFDAQIWTRLQRDPRVLRAFGAWSACMRERGYRYADPIVVNDDERWQSERPSATELATATADVSCKRATKLVEIWFGAEAAAQRQAIAGHPREFQSLKAAKQRQLANARAVIASASG